jgi:hypothetical protein
VAFGHDTKFDITSLDQFQRRLGRVPLEASKQVSKRNRQHANQLRDVIRREMPVSGGTVKYRHDGSKAKGLSRKGGARRGAMKGSVRSRASADSASVVGGGTSATPHFYANEFGGEARWTSRTGEHHIPVRARSKSLAQLGLKNESGNGRGAAGWFFWPTARKYLPTIALALRRDAEAIVRRELAR